jgi:A/G-specific adenine glycosylase
MKSRERIGMTIDTNYSRIPPSLYVALLSLIMQKITSLKFQQQVLSWFDIHGRQHLPWQQNKTPYRVWISEIMLQQTQVSTVIPYYERFIFKFPDIESLANAHTDEVLHLWTGLGYYTRARNLHKTAKIISYDFANQFPNDLSGLEKLPGIGRSTAGAILSIAFEQAATILDGNVKRVLTRFHGITEWPGEKKILDLLWSIAEKYSPKKRTADYSQAMMDLGATICVRGKPLCLQCPLKKSCVAHLQGIEKSLPKSKPKKTMPTRQATLLFIKHKNRVLLEKRPPTGIWGGLWSPPEISGHSSQKQIQTFCNKHFKLTINDIELNESFRHTFSHFHLDILPAMILASVDKTKIMDSEQYMWFNLRDPQNIGLPAPVEKLLNKL